MRLILLFAVFVLWQQVAPTADKPSKGQPVIQGEIADSLCGRTHTKQPGLGSTGCTRYCVSHGAQYMLISGTKIYQLRGRTELLENFAGLHVNITGKIHGNSIDVENVTPDTF